MPTSTPQKVRVERSTLFVGDTTYPLRNVARTQLRTLYVHPPAPPLPTWPGMLQRLSAITGGISLLVAIGAFGSDNAGFGVWSLLWVLIWGALFYYGFKESNKPQPKPKARKYHALDVTTTGRPESRLVADDESDLRELSEAITDAIHDPKREYVSVINSYTFNSSDTVNVAGENAVGKIDGHGSVNFRRSAS
ncbi:DUF6232 family protein [Myceligenerans pegani]|uniref:Uncharacterized protein n=1 Tax=Myceligenerans pegani TaxID=2776917 RepID=A0ABR9MYX6_9MICO|nr:DUF6232 family protein [Myceligenerans sp. TRM 65318]MBE1876598.1 hypothetical protein [Myceligenerans sp. TRM 65318]MBE3018869.1 hypothetical protein [Myceligenerans sp. TRM 65318]